MRNILFALTVLIVACEPEVTIEVIDGCQYIRTETYSRGDVFVSRTHKGNCSNPIHSYNVVVADTVERVPITNKKKAYGFYPNNY